MTQQYGVLIIEDDFRVADINRQFIEQSEGFVVRGLAKTRAEAVDILEASAQQIDLILLDAYIPDVQGMDLMWELRRRWRHLDIVMITAAKEVETIQEAMRGGVFDYLIKPTEGERMRQMLLRFRSAREALSGRSEMDQESLDEALHRGRQAESVHTDRLPKGIDRLTLDNVRQALESLSASVTAVEVGSAIGVSRSTARRYLEFLVSEQEVTAELGYGEVGRPERRYRRIGPA
ncbi:response regulator [Natronospirillum operosum]|uniref:Transcriptional regulatory protein n=1 Tax=Natronospirillum operosum TaxID=2759953 RepID=A0A4Z0WA11_9GAMM|nr:response regulator [Natronospirillum operosum]TGG92396.1 response regulator [Natronospirillum operosum]